MKWPFADDPVLRVILGRSLLGLAARVVALGLGALAAALGVPLDPAPVIGS